MLIASALRTANRTSSVSPVFNHLNAVCPKSVQEMLGCRRWRCRVRLVVRAPIPEHDLPLLSLVGHDELHSLLQERGSVPSSAAEMGGTPSPVQTSDCLPSMHAPRTTTQSTASNPSNPRSAQAATTRHLRSPDRQPTGGRTQKRAGAHPPDPLWHSARWGTTSSARGAPRCRRRCRYQRTPGCWSSRSRMRHRSSRAWLVVVAAS